VGAGGAIVLDRDGVVQEAMSAGLFVTGIIASAPGQYGPQPEARPVLQVAARRAPTPSQRRDIAIGRRLLPVLHRHGAGRAALIDREHVLAIAGGLPLPKFLGAQGRASTWGRRTFGGQRGVLVLDADRGQTADALLDREVFEAALASSIAGIVVSAPMPEGEAHTDLLAWANEAKVFLMCTVSEP
ncbi:MAG: hypothetical protein ACK5JT_16930, partial [Hyphomicrobiaceae bacterium]